VTVEVEPTVDNEADPTTAKPQRFYERLTRVQQLDFAAEMAADMKTGVYEEASGVTWTPRAYVMTEIMRRMGYGPHRVRSGYRPSWWPKGGAHAFEEYVEWIIARRRMQGNVRFAQVKPLLEAILGMTTIELGRRLILEPESVDFRDLTDLHTKTARLFVDRGVIPPGSGGTTISPDGADAFVQITAAFKNLPEGPAREQVRALVSGLMGKAELAVEAAGKT
jgi:hypothetical protein